MRPVCVIGHAVQGEHLDRCADPGCPGCLPALAAAGLAVCTGHELDVRAALRDLPGLWADLGDTRRSPSLDGTGGGSGDPEACPDCDAGLPCTRRHRSGHEALSPSRIEARHAIRALLVRWCRILDEDLAVPLPPAPPDTIRWMGHHVARHAGRILAHPQHAYGLVVDLHGWWDGEQGEPGVMAARRLLDAGQRPRGVRVQCPRCGAWVRLREDVDIIRCPGVDPDDAGEPCPEWGTIEHWRRLVPDAGRPMTGAELVDWLARHHRYRTTEDVLRQWASRGTRHGKLTRVGEDEQGRTLYDPIRAAELVMLGRGVLQRAAGEGA